MKKINIYVDSSVRWAAYKKDDEYQAWIDYAVANNLWGQPGSYTVEVVDATAELEQKRLQAEATKKLDFDNHANNTENPHSVTKTQIGLGNVDDVSAVDLRDRSTHTGTQLSSTISDFTEKAQLVVNGLIYKNNATVSNSTTTYTNVTSLTSGVLQPGLYSFRFFGIMQSGSTTNGVGVRIVNGTSTISTILGKWNIAQGANSTSQDFQYTQLALNTNITSASTQTANTNFPVIGMGVFRVTVAGTVVIQTRSELAGTAASLLADSFLEVKLL